MNLATTYLGLNLKNPIVPSSSPLTRSRDGLREMEDAGAAAVVLYSLFEEEIAREMHDMDQWLTHGVDTSSEALSYFPNTDDHQTGTEEYLKHISWAKRALTMPIIGSLNGVSTGGWVDYAAEIERAGADALELNVYYLPPTMEMSGSEVERMYLDVLKDVKTAVSIPVAIKLSPYFSAMGNMAKQLAGAGADGLVLFNRFYQPDLDIEALDVVPHLVLSNSNELRLPLRWVAMLYGRVQADLALTTGIHTVEDVLKGLMAGANVIMMASELLQNGNGRIAEILRDLQNWMEEHEYESVSQLRGCLSQINVAKPAAFERANYMEILNSWSSETN